jgi:hypothetical protein
MEDMTRIFSLEHFTIGLVGSMPAPLQIKPIFIREMPSICCVKISSQIRYHLSNEKIFCDTASTNHIVKYYKGYHFTIQIRLIALSISGQTSRQRRLCQKSTEHSSPNRSPVTGIIAMGFSLRCIIGMKYPIAEPTAAPTIISEG